jgi:TolB protein
MSAMPRPTALFVLIVALVLLPGCGPDQLLGPTVTATPTNTPTPTSTPTLTLTPTLTPTATPTLTPTPFGGGGKILFGGCLADESMPVCLGYSPYLMDADGSNHTLLFEDIDCSYLHWSPDGTRFAFVHIRVYGDIDTGDLYVANADGSNPTLLTQMTSSGFLTYQWSPDSTKVAYESGDDTYVVNVPPSLDDDIREPVNLTNDPVGDMGAYTWSPDGERIAFAREHEGNWNIFVMNADGSDLIELTNDDGNEMTPAWSPDGEQIAFASFQGEDVASEICLLTISESDSVCITENDWPEYEPVWSPDGTKILFSAFRGDTSELYVIQVDGSNLIRLTDNEVNESQATWSRDGTMILFTQAGTIVEPFATMFTIHRINADGTDDIVLTDADRGDDQRLFAVSASWQP